MSKEDDETFGDRRLSLWDSTTTPFVLGFFALGSLEFVDWLSECFGVGDAEAGGDASFVVDVVLCDFITDDLLLLDLLLLLLVLSDLAACLALNS